MAKRLNPYKDCLEHAAQQLERALKEHETCRTRLMKVNDEIPKLRKIIQALEAYFAKPESPAESQTVDRVVHSIQLDIPAHLQKFLKPSDTVVEVPAVPDETLPDVAGEEILE
jgi:exonuclease VII small subunit